jgi:hypothetical protein
MTDNDCIDGTAHARLIMLLLKAAHPLGDRAVFLGLDGRIPEVSFEMRASVGATL